MDESIINLDRKSYLAYEVSDEALEAAAALMEGREKRYVAVSGTVRG
jgi:hypothetical protein